MIAICVLAVGFTSFEAWHQYQFDESVLPTSDSLWINIAALIAPYVFGAFVLGWSAAWQDKMTVRAGFCAVCRYRIDDLEPNEDECYLCPECGAAWRAARVAST
ncbi:MAG: hypothetical protein AAF297_06170 [Planctomycetota bacterium]